uniref:Galectin n=1 Tax=Cyprinodon variegatus TaxID=28743 RepID=A0A3Q2E3L2_CYPVA
VQEYPKSSFRNPEIPFTGSIHGGLQEGKSIIISGRVLPGVDRFHVNLQCGSSQGTNIAFHFNPRYNEGQPYVVTNTFQYGNWGSEERKLSSPLPPGYNFTLQITVTRDFYQVSVNGSHFTDYRHRIPFQQVDTISVAGKVEVSFISFSNPNVSLSCHLFPSEHQIICSLFSLFAQVVPYNNYISGGIQPGRTITIQGIVPPNATRFHVNFSHQYGIALHYNPRFNENTVVRNTKQHGQWGSEERMGIMPFQRGQAFTALYSSPYCVTFMSKAQRDTFTHEFINHGAEKHPTPMRNYSFGFQLMLRISPLALFYWYTSSGEDDGWRWDRGTGLCNICGTLVKLFFLKKH